MAFGTVGALIAANNNASSTSWTPAAAGNAMSVGQLGVVSVATDNVDTTDGPSVQHILSDSVGNEWRKVYEYENSQAAAGAGATVSLWICVVEFAFSVTDTLTLTLRNAVTSKSMIGYIFSTGSDFYGVEAVSFLVNTAADAGSMTLSSLRNAEHLFIRAIATENTSTAFTPSTNYTSFGTPSAASGGMAARGEFRIYTGTTDTSDPTTVAADQSSVYVAIRELKRAEHATPRPLFVFSSATNSTSYGGSNNLTAPNYRRILAVVKSESSSGTPTTPTFTGGGLTWTQVATEKNGPSSQLRLTVFKAFGPQTIPEPVLADFAGQTQVNCIINIFELENSGDVVQSVTAQARTATLAAFAKSSNCGVAFTFRNSFPITFAQGNAFDPTATDWQFASPDGYVADTYGYTQIVCWTPDNTNLTFTGQQTSAALVTIMVEVDYKPSLFTTGLPSAEAHGDAFLWEVGSVDGPSVRDFRGAFDDPATTPEERYIPFGRRALCAFDVPTDTFTASLIAPLDGVVIYDAPPPEPEAVVCDPTDMVWEIEGASQVEIDACGVEILFEIGTACIEEVASYEITPHGVEILFEVGTACIETSLSGVHPVITFISPPLGEAVYRFVPIVFTVTGSPLRRVWARVSFLDRDGWHLAYDGAAFGPEFTGPDNTKTGPTSGQRFSILMDGGWPSQPLVAVYAVDILGNEAEAAT